ncbi:MULTISPECIES: permease [Halocynthiibacter]|uniref:Permease n=1 Tax=Halocynthiibacter halioticoli TaxID=2986804 RepID=A0AAE3LQH7_9RHOB|nr:MULTISPECIES: permease [Halocynthiibacter]MCV6823528.1 permease [Halocynthiibacter halioticoli]MCW4056529.1 permease [Halocynthiibacter sp. SDUM655004]
MTDTPHTHAPATPPIWRRIDGAWAAIVIIPLLVAIFDPAQFVPTITFAGGAIAHTGIFIVFAVLTVGYLKASGAEALLAKAFTGRETQMIFMAAALGGLSPFCSCEVIPFIAALLALGAPLSAVMAFWLASPLMDPAMFFVTAGTLGFDFAIAKGIAAIALGIFGGFTVRLFANSAVFADPLKQRQTASGCGCGPSPFKGKPVWNILPHADRRSVFGRTVLDNALFLGKWLLLAYMIEALMLNYIPAEKIAGVLGGDGVMPILLGALIGAPAYLNGFAAVPLVDALLQQGMSNGAAMSFVLAGGVSCIPAALAVWALVKPRVFAAYIGIAMVGAFLAGLSWSLVA